MTHMRPALSLAIAAVLVVGACQTRAEPQQTRRSTTTTTPAQPLWQRSNLWGGQAHIAIAASRDCADLQSWFDAGEAVFYVFLDKEGSTSQSANTAYAMKVMDEADARMRAVGCYDR